MHLRSSSFDDSSGARPDKPVTPDPVQPHPEASTARRSRKRLLLGGALAAVIAVGGAVAVVVTGPAQSGKAEGFTRYVATGEPFTLPAGRTAMSPANDPYSGLTSFIVKDVLDRQAQALLRHDLTGWLATVDPAKPKVVAYYRDLYTAMQALDVTGFAYENTGSIDITSKNDLRWQSDYGITYCFSRPECAGGDRAGPLGSPSITQHLSLRKATGGWLIEGVGKSKKPGQYEPTPWQNGGMVFARGKRVTIGATRGHDRRIKELAAIADKAAAVTDRYAAKLGSSPNRYRIYLATDKEWSAWFTSGEEEGYRGQAFSINDIQSEVVLKASALGGAADARAVIQHELGHVVAFDGTGVGQVPVTMYYDWLSEGFAEYVSYDGRPATSSDRAPAVRTLVKSRKPYHSLDVGRPSVTSKLPTINQFYGWGAFAVDCMAQKYGKPAMLGFIKDMYRTRSMTLDRAAQKNYGVPFDELSDGCVSWITKRF
ncbi:hypothetical protein Ahu01nite_071380 [Winogradskya humida]|uniref:Basic secretory peptidase family protein n=1 Tax=Winogradskya humida TaxID=113566 RepID=A0ABQ3ZZK7_9ACTN|nr:hypothetical protein Ahu01nite_071380 [Actinoplanes humidus]